MQSFPGVRDFVAAVTGGNTLEQAGFDAAQDRLLRQRSSQALIDKRLEEAAIAKRQNEAQEAISGLSTIDSGVNQGQALAAGGFNLNTFASGIDQIIQSERRKELEQQRLTEGFTPGNALVQAFKPELVKGVDIEGGIGVRNQFGADQSIDETITDALNSMELKKAKTGAIGAKEREIQYFMEVLGLTREDAVKQAFDKTGVRVDSLGNIINVDEIAGTARSVPLGGGISREETPAPPPGGTMMELAAVGTGLAPVTSDAFAKVSSLFGGDPDFAPTRAIAQVKSMAIQVINSQRLNSKFTDSERKDLLKRFDLDPKLLRSSGTLIANLQALKNTLEIKAEQAEADARRTDITTQAIGDARNSARLSRNAIALIGDTRLGSAIPSIRNGRQPQQMEGFENLTPEEQQELIDGLGSGGQ